MAAYKGPSLYHPDGIRVTLIPKGKRNSIFRNPDFWQKVEDDPDYDYDGRYLTCSIDHHDVEFEIEVFFAGRFKMYNGEAVNVGIGKGTCSPDDRVIADPDYTWRSAVAWKPFGRKFISGANLLEKSWKMRLAMDALPHAGPQQGLVLDADDEPYNMNLSPGSISIIVQRGHLTELRKLSERQLISGVHYVRSSFGRLKGVHGQKYLFEFCPRHGANDEVVRNVPLGVQETPASRDQVSGGDSSDSDDDSDEDTPALRRSGDGGGPPLPRSRRTASVAYRPRRRRKQPQICDCPSIHHPRMRQSSLDADDVSVAEGNGIGRSVGGGAPNFRGNVNINTAGKRREKKTARKQGPRLTVQEDAGPEEGEKTAEPCRRCAKLRKPPTGKKIGWRARTGRWMVMPRSSREDTPPYEDADEDDAEDGDSAIEIESVNGDESVLSSEEPDESSHSPSVSRLPSPARASFWERDGSETPTLSEDEAFQRRNAEEERQQDDEDAARRARSETSGLFMTAEPSTPRRESFSDPDVQQDAAMSPRLDDARSSTPEEPDADFEERVRRFKEGRQRAHTILNRPARQPISAFTARIANMGRYEQRLEPGKDVDMEDGTVAMTIEQPTERQPESPQTSAAPFEELADDRTREQQDISNATTVEQDDTAAAIPPTAGPETAVPQPLPLQADFSDIGIKPEKDTPNPPCSSPKRPGSPHTQSSPAKVARTEDPPATDDAKVDMKKKEETEEPDKKLIPNLTRFSIGTGDGLISLLSEDEDEEEREIAELERAAKANERELERRRNLRRIRVRGGGVEVIE